MGIGSLLLVCAGFVSGYITKAYHLLFVQIKLDDKHGRSLYNKISGRKQFLMVDQYIQDNHREVKCPEKYDSIIFLHGILMRVLIDIEYLKTGWDAKEGIFNVTVARFQYKKFIKFMDYIAFDHDKVDSVDVHISRHWGFRKTNTLFKKNNERLYINDSISSRLDPELNKFIRGERSKIGILLFGPPGNGKTSLVKHLALEHMLDIYVMKFDAGTDNDSLLESFLSLPRNKKSICLFEDFDSVFNLREPLYKECKFSLDTILNLIDGVYVDISNVLFIMTANDIDKIDPALKNRPSRFDLLLKLDNPEFKQRLDIFERYGTGKYTRELVEMTNGKSAAICREVAKSSFSNPDHAKAIISSFQ